MPNTKSAIKAMRSSARKFENNRGIRSRLKTLEKAFIADADANNADAAGVSLKKAVSAYDKAAKTNIVHRGKADRKKSRLMKRFAKIAASS